MIKLASALLLCLALVFSCSVLSYAQSSSGTIRGSVLDPSGAAVVGATVEIQNPVSHYSRSTQTDAQGNFEFDNIPYNPYHLTVAAADFQTSTQDVDIRSAIPLGLKITLTIGTSTTNVTVMAGADLIENDSTSHTDVDRALFDKLPLERPFSWIRGSRLKLILSRWPADHRPAEQGFLQSASGRCRTVVGGYTGRTPSRVWRQN
jgi:hypothetical protein